MGARRQTFTGAGTAAPEDTTMHKTLPWMLLAALALLATPVTAQENGSDEPPDPTCEEDPQQLGCDPACAEPGTECDHPPCPTSLHGYQTEDRDVFMSWTLNSFDDVNVYRAEGDGEFELIDTLEFPTTRYIDFDTEPGQTYRYKVTAVDEDGTESPSCGVFEVTTIPVFSTPLAMGLAAGVGAVAYVGLRRRG